jgi:hypothetical protein
LTGADLALTAGLAGGLDFGLGLATEAETGLALTGAALTGLAFAGTVLTALAGATVLAFGWGLAATDGLTAGDFFWTVTAVFAALEAALAGAFLGVVTSCLLALKEGRSRTARKLHAPKEHCSC